MIFVEDEPVRDVDGQVFERFYDGRDQSTMFYVINYQVNRDTWLSYNNSDFGPGAASLSIVLRELR